ncbi:MAG: bifunctional protein-serine/threonine kinase/phosphatase [Magnetococcales bacterium]|nr:bifunctional protein-serine/threonine kinase/phosphatase [Magnetococcales bacterium]
MHPSPELSLGLTSNAGPLAKNEDFHGAVLPDGVTRQWGVLVCVADGIGGCSDARHASESTVRALLNDYYATPLSWSAAHALDQVTLSINSWMYRAGGRLERGLGTTLVAALFRGRQLTVLWAGDSRIYRFREGRLELLSRDHSFPTQDASMITKAVGIDSTFHPDIREEPLREGDRFLLTTDGVTGVLSDARLSALAGTLVSSQELADAIIGEALARKCRDNVTAVVVDVIALPSPEAANLAREWEETPVITPPAPGEMLDGFRMVRKIHSGSQGTLLVAVDTQTQANVVLKFPDPLAVEDPDNLERFLREEWMGLKVRHANVVEVIAQPPGRRSAIYFVMQALEGTTLEQVLKGMRQGAPPESVVDWLRQAAHGMLALHRKGIIHRDIKPENLFLTRSGQVILLDLGTARVAGLEPLEPDAVGRRVVGGTPGFMAPELYQGERGDESSDLFALGVTGYYLLTGRLPFGQPESNVMPDFSAWQPILTVRPDAPQVLAALLERCLSPDPQKRPGDMGEFLFWLDRPALEGMKFVPLLQRNPLRFYQVGFWLFLSTSLILALCLLSRY